MASSFDFSSKIAFVTGGTRGIGLSTVRLFLSSGAKVVFSGMRDESAIAQLSDSLSKEFGEGRAKGIRCDVSDAGQVRDSYRSIMQDFGGIDILVNNAGLLSSQLLGMTDAAAIAQLMQTNIGGVLTNMQFASRLMSRRGGGAIVNLASIVGVQGNSGQALYSATKAAVLGLTKSAAKELGPQNIRVNAVAPGFIDTDMTRGLAEPVIAERVRLTPMGRMGTADEVAKVIVFLASDWASFVTGAVVGVDGGMII